MYMAQLWFSRKYWCTDLVYPDTITSCLSLKPSLIEHVFVSLLYRCFKDGDAKSTLSVPVGNVMDTTNLMYEFSNTESKCSQIEALLHC